MSEGVNLVRLEGGRQLTYAEYGDPKGRPVLYCHGFPGSRLDWQLVDPGGQAAQESVRIIAPDRPGMGGSGLQPGRRLLDWPKDVAALMDSLGIGRFGVLGYSGGAPYAAACAAVFSERIRCLAIVSGMGPANAPGSRTGMAWTLPGKPALLRLLILKLMQFGLQKDPERFLSKTLQTFAPADSALLGEEPLLAGALLATLGEALRTGPRGASADAAVLAGPWGFRLEDLPGPVKLWHGTDDVNVPVSVGRWVAERFPHCAARFIDGEGHLTLSHRYLRDVLRSVGEEGGDA
jgi:pimeloyl-ACP methyl ester carboxylesterase